MSPSAGPPVRIARTSRRALVYATAYLLCFVLIVLATTEMSSFDVADFGAKGDGASDDAPAVQAALDAAAPVSGTVTLRAGTYFIGSSLLLRSGVTVRGVPEETVLFMLPQASQTFIMQGTSLSDVELNGLTFRANTNTDNVSGLYMVGARNCDLHGLRLENLSYGMKLGSGPMGLGWLVEDVVARGCEQPLYASHIRGCVFRDLDLEQSGGEGSHCVYLERECRQLTFQDCTFKGGTGYTLHLYPADGASSDIAFTSCSVDATDGRYPAVIATGFSNIRFRDLLLVMRADSDGVCVRLALPSNVTIDGFTASGGSALAGIYGDQTRYPERVLFRNGSYRGPRLGDGADFENVKQVEPIGP